MTYIPPTRDERQRAVVEAARPLTLIATVTDDLFLAPPDEVDSVIARVPAFVDWIDYGVTTGASRILGGRKWIAVRFQAKTRSSAALRAARRAGA